MSFWNEKPFWCQPWSILLTGLTLLIVNFLYFYYLWLKILVALFIFIWWWLFLIVAPTMYISPEVEDKTKRL